MKLYRCGGDGNSVLNMDLMVSADYHPAKERLELRFAAPQPTDVGACNRAVEAHEVVLKGVEAADCWEWIACQATPVR